MDIAYGIYIYHVHWLGAILFLIVLLTLLTELFKGIAEPLINSATTLMGVIYVGLFSSFILIREMPEINALSYRAGGWLVLLIFASIWICDTGAYAFGTFWGKHPLYKRVSPKKRGKEQTKGY